MTDQTVLNAYCDMGVKLVETAAATVREHLSFTGELSVTKLARKRDRAAQAWAWLCGCHSKHVLAKDVYAVGGLDVADVERELSDEFTKLNPDEFRAVYTMAANEFAWV
jgi:hypothetical protein